MFPCDECRKTFSTRQAVKRHMEKKVCQKRQKQEGAQNCCPNCNKIFADKYKLQTHLKGIACPGMKYDIAPMTTNDIRVLYSKMDFENLKPNNFVRIMVQYLLKGRVICTDVSRKTFFWKNKDDLIIKDPLGRMLIDMIHEEISDYAVHIIDKHIKKQIESPAFSEKIDNFTSNCDILTTYTIKEKFITAFTKIIAVDCNFSKSYTAEDAYITTEKIKKKVKKPKGQTPEKSVFRAPISEEKRLELLQRYEERQEMEKLHRVLFPKEEDTTIDKSGLKVEIVDGVEIAWKSDEENDDDEFSD